MPFPAEQVSSWAALLNAAASYWALLTVCQLAQPKLGRYGFWRHAGVGALLIISGTSVLIWG